VTRNDAREASNAELEEALRDELHCFSRSAQERGSRYARSGRVVGTQRSGHSVFARVRGTIWYQTAWHWTAEEGWLDECSCPIGMQCKHAYAVAHDALRLGLFSERAPERRGVEPTIGRAVVPRHGALAALRNARSEWEASGAAVRLLGWDTLNRLRSVRPLELAAALEEPDGELRCWRMARVLGSIEGLELPDSLAAVLTHGDLAERAAEADRAHAVELLAAWADRPRPNAAPKSLRLVWTLEGHGDSLAVRATARLTSRKLVDEPRTQLQLEQLLSECRQRPGTLCDGEHALLQMLVQARIGGRDQSLAAPPSSFRALVAEVAERPLACWDPELPPDLAARFGLEPGSCVRVGAGPARIDPVCIIEDGEPALALQFCLEDGRAFPPHRVVLVPAAALWDGRDGRLALVDGAFHPVVGEPPPAGLLERLGAGEPVRLRRDRERPLLRLLAARFESVRRSAAPLVREVAATPLVLADLREDRWLHLRLVAHDGPPDWAPGDAWPEHAHAFERHPGREFVETDLDGTTRSSESSEPISDTPWLAAPKHVDVAPAIAWLDAVLGSSPAVPPASLRGLGGHWQELTSEGLDRLASGMEALPAPLKVYVTPSLRKLFEDSARARLPRLNASASGIDFFEVSAEWEQEADALSAEDMAALHAASTRFVKLRSGWVQRARVAGQEAVLAALADLGSEPGDGTARVGIAQLARASSQSLDALQMLPQAAASLEALREMKKRVARFSGVPAVPLPEGLQATLRPYQKTGVDFLAHASSLGLGAVLADDMGLGKTLQALAWLLHLRTLQPGAGPSLVVCPTSVLHNWLREAQRFTPGLRVAVLERGRRRHALRAGAHEHDLLLTTYALLRRDIDEWEKIELHAAVLDEAQNVKNPDSLAARAALRLRARHRLVLTGTPLENRLLDLWSLVAFTNPGLLGARKRFTRRYEGPDAPPHARAALAARLRPILLRRLKSDVAPELPERIEERRDCDLSPGQRKLYLAELRRSRDRVLDMGGSRQQQARQRVAVLAALTRLRQICCHPALAGGSRAMGSGKLEALFEVLEPLLDEGHKVLVFSQFVRCLEIVRGELDARDIAYHLLTGKSTRRDAIVHGFQEDPRPGVFLVSLKAGGTGLNLTAASYVVLLDPWWNPAVEAQAIDRTHRIGQERTVVAYRLVARGTVEEKILELQERKAAMVRDVLGEEGFARSLDQSDLQYLFAEEG
jgi:superfamily II DNA or RNA helicase